MTLKFSIKDISTVSVLLSVFLMLVVGCELFDKGSKDISKLDTVEPVIVIVGDNPQELELGGTYIELGAAAVDNIDGDISTKIVIDSSAVDTTKIGRYKVFYNVLDAAGNAGETEIRVISIKERLISKN